MKIYLAPGVIATLYVLSLSSCLKENPDRNQVHSNTESSENSVPENQADSGPDHTNRNKTDSASDGGSQPEADPSKPIHVHSLSEGHWKTTCHKGHISEIRINNDQLTWTEHWHWDQNCLRSDISYHAIYQLDLQATSASVNPGSMARHQQSSMIVHLSQINLSLSEQVTCGKPEADDKAKLITYDTSSCMEYPEFSIYFTKDSGNLKLAIGTPEQILDQSWLPADD